MKRIAVLVVAISVILVSCIPGGRLVSTPTSVPTATPTPTATGTPLPTATPSPSPTITPTPPTVVIHIVEAGDTLSELAVLHGTTVEAIAEASGLEDVHWLSLGQKLVIPLPGFTPEPPDQPDGPVPPPESELCQGLEVIRAQDALDHLGQFVCVEFKVASTADTGLAVYLNSHDPAESQFRIVIVPEWQDCWREGPEDYFQDRWVLVRGTIEQYLDAPRILLGHCSAVEIVP